MIQCVRCDRTHRENRPIHRSGNFTKVIAPEMQLGAICSFQLLVKENAQAMLSETCLNFESGGTELHFGRHPH